jgi:hypothetical protein
MAFLGGRMILEFEYRRSKMEKIYRRIRTVYTIANTEISNSYFQDRNTIQYYEENLAARDARLTAVQEATRPTLLHNSSINTSQ